MNIKQKVLVVTLVLVASFVGSLASPSSVFALTKSKFSSILCDDFQGPSGVVDGTLADECRKDAQDGTLSKKWYDKTIKFADWKDKTASQLYKHIGKKAPGAPDDSPTTGGTTGDCGGVKTAIVRCSQDNKGGVENNGVWGILLMIISIMTAGVGVLAVGGIVYGAILYSTAEDNASQVKQATDIITNVVIGLVAFALMWAGLNFLIPGGVFA